jgi:hypothetical protein
MPAPPSSEPFLRVVEVDGDEVSERPDALHEIFSGTLDVVIVRRAFPESTMREVVKALERGQHRFVVRPQEKPDLSEEQVVVYGDGINPNFVEGNGPPMDRYLANARDWRVACRELFAMGPDYEERMREIFAAMSGRRRVGVPNHLDGRHYSPSTIRRIPPGHFAPFHVGNYFLYLEGYKHLATLIDMSDQISFFTTLLPAERGGEIEVYDVRFDDPRAREVSNREADYPQFRSQAFPLGAGDLFVFDGGRFWHRVSKVIGDRVRWTIGGFMGFGLDRQSIYWWG